MDCLKELEYYCRGIKPAGAILLTGEWGCGKTYFIEHELKDALRYTHILLRISLFGIATTEELHATVKKKWIEAFIQEKGVSEKSLEIGEKAANALKDVSTKVGNLLPDTVKNFGSILSVDIMNCISIRNKIADKVVILIFDDLERPGLSESERFGCINEYCENQNFPTIVIANEEKVKENDTDSFYKEMKEKLIQRTIHFEGNYKRVVANIIKGNNWRCKNYSEFLSMNEATIASIFSGTAPTGGSLNITDSSWQKLNRNREEQREDEKRRISLQQRRPHNIRSLKCGLQDFERIYELLVEKDMPDKERWLYSYLTYTFAYRAGLIMEKTEYGDLFSTDNMAILYPGYYNSRYMINGMIQWIRSGKWSDQDMNMELDDVIERDSASKPQDQVRTNRIIDLEDDIVMQGFPDVIQYAYAGKLSLDEYILLIENICMARKYEIKIPEVDWNQVQSAVKNKISGLIETGDRQPHIRRRICEEQRAYFMPEEWEIYQSIQRIFEESQFIFSRNQRQYIKLMKENSAQAFAYAENHRFGVFDSMMAEATAEAFKRETNADKVYFPGYFEGIWKSYQSMPDIKLEETLEGLCDLKKRLENIYDEYKKAEKQIAAMHTNSFLEIIEKLIQGE